MTETPSSRPTVAQVLLGVFILGQLLFLLLGNAVPFLLSGIEPETVQSMPAAPLRGVRSLTDGWVQLTGQGQNWSLFAPLVPLRAMFVALEVDCPDGPERVIRLLSEFEPDEQGWYFHFPGSGDRLFHSEKELAWPLAAWAVDPDRVVREPVQWQEYLTQEVRKHWRAYRAYLTWRSGSCCHRPESVVLSVRLYPPSVAGQMPAEKDIIVFPVVRCRLDHEGEPDATLPLEVYDTHKRQFLPLSRLPER